MSSGPVYIRTCCDQLWYISIVSVIPKKLEHQILMQRSCYNTRANNAECLFQTCIKHLKNGRVPPLAVVKRMKFPENPAFFTLMGAFLHPDQLFKKLCKPERRKKLKINGNVVNVPADVIDTVNLLPRLLEQAGTIKIQLKAGCSTRVLHCRLILDQIKFCKQQTD